MTLRIPLIYVKDKQAFSKDGGTLRLIGNPTELSKKMKKGGIELIHIVDLDAQKGNSVNLDIYDKLTYFIHIEVEGPKDEKTIKRLLEINARVVVSLPTRLDLKKFAEKKRLLVGKIENAKDAAGDVFDLIYCGDNEKEINALLKNGKRIIIFDKTMTKTKNKSKLFGVIFDFSPYSRLEYSDPHK